MTQERHCKGTTARRATTNTRETGGEIQAPMGYGAGGAALRIWGQPGSHVLLPGIDSVYP